MLGQESSQHVPLRPLIDLIEPVHQKHPTAQGVHPEPLQVREALAAEQLVKRHSHQFHSPEAQRQRALQIPLSALRQLGFGLEERHRLPRPHRRQNQQQGLLRGLSWLEPLHQPSLESFGGHAGVLRGDGRNWLRTGLPSERLRGLTRGLASRPSRIRGTKRSTRGISTSSRRISVGSIVGRTRG